MRFVKVTIATIIVILGIVFIIENLEMLKNTVKIKYNLYLVFLQSPDIPIWVIILFCFFLGVFTASLYGVYEIIVQRQTIRQLRQNLEMMAHELKAYAVPEPTEPGLRPEESEAAPTRSA
jgi:hypothetical protein